MQKKLYFLCPTDCLECTINKQFKFENYFYSSLGNSFIFDSKTIGNIKEMILKQNIKEISFVLSSNNTIIEDALGSQSFLKTRGLKSLYGQIIKQKKCSEILYQSNFNSFLILSYYLNAKIKELKFELEKHIKYPLKINGKIYNRFENVFKDIYADLICIEKHSLN